MSNIETIEPQPGPPAAPARQASAIKEAIAGASSSLRIIAIGVIFAFLYWASSVVIAVLLSVLLAYFLDPFVTALEHVHIPRALGALLVLLAATTAVGAVGYMALGHLDTFVADWPRYSAVLKSAATDVDRRLSSVDQQVAQLTSQKRIPVSTAVENAQPVRALLLRGLGSLYSILLVWTFLPFLVFFMLAAKRKIWQSTLGLFPEGQGIAARETLNQVSSMLRSYIIGNALVAAILIAACGAFFWSIHLDYPFVIAVASGLLNLIPYLGVVLSWLPPFVIGLTHWKTAGPYLGVAGVLAGLHLLAMNVLMPAIVGRRVHLNAVAVTIALLFWGWLWGAAGLILAIPITAVLKVVCDHVPSWQPTGRWLGS
jgi:predicted PurR-regulated permease PerM